MQTKMCPRKEVFFHGSTFLEDALDIKRSAPIPSWDMSVSVDGIVNTIAYITTFECNSHRCHKLHPYPKSLNIGTKIN